MAPAADTGKVNFCHQCGERAQSGDKFCRNCGTALKGN
jgi:predicted amidophosphoribosyltransferase